MIAQLIKLMRPHQYVKNGFVLVGVVFAQAFDTTSLLAVGLAFAAFCAMASAVYIFNDIFDAAADREHPTKKHRPLAAKKISLGTGWALCAALTAAALGLALQVGDVVFAIVAAYALLNLAYSLSLKHIAVLDVFIISGGFMLRILAGTLGIGIAPTDWLLLCGLMLTLFLGFAKRRAEMFALESNPDPKQTRRVLDDYSPRIVEQFISISAACTILTYSLYTVSPETIALHGTSNLIYTVPLVVFGMYRYLFLLHSEGKGSDTARDLYTDAQLLLTVLVWGGATLLILR